MTRINFIEHNGKSHLVEVADGSSLMQAAVDNMVPGIVADCGGACSCATCHCYIEGEWAARVAPAQELEVSMIESATHTRASSRLSCQIKVTPELDGLVVHLPVSQF